MHNFTLINCDTDSVSFSKSDGSSFTEVEQKQLLEELNSLYPPKIRFEHDGVFETVCILKAKNYIMKAYVCKKCKKAGLTNCNHEARVTKKGSSIKSSKIEPAIKEFMDEIIAALLNDRVNDIYNIYIKYIKEVQHLKDISRYSSKKTVTNSVLNPSRTNEEKVLDALNGRSVQMGDKIYTYFAEVKTQEEKIVRGKPVMKDVITNPLKLKEDWDSARPDHSISKLMKRLHDTLLIFENVIDVKQFPNFTLKSNKEKLESL